MVPSPATVQQQHGWQRCWRQKGPRYLQTWRGDPHASSQTSRPPTALPNGNSAGGSASPVGVLDRDAAAATSSTGPTPAPSDPPTLPGQIPDRSIGYISLSMVPILWGTYNPCIRYLYAEADPLDPASLTAVRTMLSAGALLLPALVGFLVKKGRESWRRKQGQAAINNAEGAEGQPSGELNKSPLGVMTLAMAADGAADGVAAAAAADEMAVGARPGPSSPSHSLFAEPLNHSRLGPILTRTFGSVALGGLELGILNFLGTALQVEGLHSTSATRAGFLAEVTAVLTPFVSYLAGYDIPRQMWLAVAVGLVGSTMVAYDTSQPHGSQAQTAGAAVATPAGTASAPAAAMSPSLTQMSSAGISGSDNSEIQNGLRAPEATDASCVAGSVDAVLQTPDGSAPEGSILQTADSAVPASASVGGEVMSFPADAGGVAHTISGTTSAGIRAGADIGAGAIASVPVEAANVATAADLLTSNISAAAYATTSVITVANGAAATAPVDLASPGADAAPFIAPLTSTAVDAAGNFLPTIASSAVEAVGPSTADGAAAVAAVAEAAVASAAPLAITGGEAYLLLACLFYSICTVRMGIYAPRMDTVGLAAMKKVGLSSMSFLWMAATNLQNGVAPGAVLAFPDLSNRTPMSIAVLMYSGLGPGALATFLQVTGLSTVPATTAQVIYSMTPLCTAFFAYLILGGEATGPVAWAGGSLIIIAALIAADAQQKQFRKQLQQQQ
ncbi:hypothetical protein Vretimale_4126 [Volvox reticuliferus]|uniref:EamA domain-containing protein n=1 Tax=Volvox reticuliferus TaxID=1737510 RepID=A0A8J4DB53_9CHLO|nr:hypothetical protein Vretimale_4126 [Volvox reticuliferus]